MNNDNLQSPPYLLEAAKQAEQAANIASSNNNEASLGADKGRLATDDSSSATRSEGSVAPSAIVEAGEDQLMAASSEESADNSAPADFSVVKEETVEEILDLDPESAMRAIQAEGSSPAVSSVAQDEPMDRDPSEEQSSAVSQSGNQASGTSEVGQVSRKAQTLLEVTSSHLKRPATQMSPETDSSSQPPASENSHESGGAKSLISPSVAAEDSPGPSNAELLKRKVKPNPPDLWAPHQVMNNAGNGSTVPAIVNRDYGHHTRTRITLGGGYVRDRTPVEPPPSTVSRDQPERKREREQERDRQKATETTHVVEVPERIVLTEETAPATPARKPHKPAVEVAVAPTTNKTKLKQQGKPDPRCPKQGTESFEHPTACDKYLLCEDGYLSERVCPNGLMYGLRDTVVDYCVQRWTVSCEDKSQPNPISSPGCRWQYGIFNVQGSPKCTPDYYECTAGNFEVKKCSIDGQVYDDRTKTCRFAEQVGCQLEALNDFQCPPDDQSNTYWPFPRYFLNERALIHCINDKPQIVRCTEHEKVDPEHLHCVLTSKLRPNNPDDSTPLAERRLPSQRRKTKQEA